MKSILCLSLALAIAVPAVAAERALPGNRGERPVRAVLRETTILTSSGTALAAR
jgi:hypothetical protein